MVSRIPISTSQRGVFTKTFFVQLAEYAYDSASYSSSLCALPSKQFARNGKVGMKPLRHNGIVLRGTAS